jgi:predicted amidohydrolase YtcJ
LKLVPEGTPEELADSLEANLRRNLALGITSLTDATTSFDEYEGLWTTVYGRAGDTLPRATVQVHPDLKKQGLESAIADLRAFGRKTGEGDSRLKVGPLKIYVDGGFTGPAAWTLEPYRSDPEYFGKPAVDIEEMYELVKFGHENGWQFGIHAIGDRAIVEAVAVLKRVLDESPMEDHRHYLNHFTVMPPAETMKTMAEYDIAITQQPNFAYTLERRYVEHLGGVRLEYNNPVGTPMKHGIRVALSSDILPIGPMVGLYAAVTRKGMSGEVYGADDRITIEQALRAYTYGGAYQHRDEGLKGTLEAGKLADMVVLSDNLLAIEPERLLGVDVQMTILGGRVVFEHDAHTQ